MSDDFNGPLALDSLTLSDLNFLKAAGTVGGFDPRTLVTASHDDASRALGSGVYHGLGGGGAKNMSWQDFLAKVSQNVKDQAAKAVNPQRSDMYAAFLAYQGSYQSQRSLMV